MGVGVKIDHQIMSLEGTAKPKSLFIGTARVLVAARRRNVETSG
jgi:hypothetical protein